MSDNLDPPTDSAFATLASLLALVADPKAAKARLTDLERQQAAAVEAEASLAVVKAAHDQYVASTMAALGKKENELAERELRVLRLEAALNERIKFWRERVPVADNLEKVGPGTLTRRREVDPPPPHDIHFENEPRTAA
ncbi:MAG TPA: hypothetical protein VH206_17455 [Xanthobacteraceae bacterium]|nr:hypothetical protein [Xanthobacteraceae bacterium]